MVSVKEQWRAWREDYRCTRPAVTCESCGAHYKRGEDEGNATYIGYALKSCGACHRDNELKRASARVMLKLHRHIQARKQKEGMKPIREIHRDVAVRYLERYEGHTFSVQTEIDDCDIYLCNAFSLAIAKVLPTDKYPTPPSDEVFDDIPY